MNDNFSIIDNRKITDPKASVLISVYNQDWCIELVLDSLMNQSHKNFEILVLDDGSSDKTRDKVLKYPIFLISHEHKGFGKTRITNEATKYIKSNYMILLDGDCIPHKDFVKSHLERRSIGYYLGGRRVDIPRSLTEKYLSLSKKPEISSFLLRNFWLIERPNRILQWKNPILRKIFKQDKIHDMMGCNGSFWKNDFVDVNGYDERYVKAHREDGDLCVRLKKSGLKLRSVKGLALIYHLWHERQPYYENEEIFNETLKSQRIKAIKGLSSRR